MKPKSLLVLALLVIGLGAVVWFGRDLPSLDDRADRAKRVLPLEADEVLRLEIEWGDHQVVLERQENSNAEGASTELGDWMLTSPVAARADGGSVDGLVARLVGLEKERVLEDVDRADVGLAAPRATVRLVTQDSEHTLEVGAEIPASSNMTLALDGGSDVYVVPAAIWSALATDPDEWRDKKLFRGRRSDIERITLESDGERVLLAKRGDDFWVESPAVDRADETLVNELLSTITSLVAERFVDQAGQEIGGAFATSIEIVLAGEESPLRLEVGAKESDGEDAARYLRVDGQLVTSRAGLVEPAQRKAAQWSSKELVAGEVYELERVEIEDALGKTELRRIEADWQRDGQPIDYGAATDFLYEISGVTAERVIDATAAGELGSPSLTVRLVSGADNGAEADGGQAPAVETLTFYASREGETPARVAGRRVVLMLSNDTAAGLTGKVEALRGAEVILDEPAEELEH